MSTEVPSAPSWFSYSLAVIVALLSMLWGWLRGDIKDIKEAQKSFVKSDTVARIEERQQEMIGMQGRFVTHDELRLELEGRFNEMDTRRLQMHNHTMGQISQLVTSVEGLRSDMREDLGAVRAEVASVHVRIDSGARRRARDQI